VFSQISSTSTNKQPLLIDRPLFDAVRVTTQIAGAVNTLFVQGGQAPAILVDMDANLSEDNNNGGVIDSIYIVRDDFYRGVDHTVSTGTSGTPISFVSGQIAQIVSTGILTDGGAPFEGVGFYTYTGSGTLTGVNTAIAYSTGVASGFRFEGTIYGYQPAVNFVFYQTRGTTTPIPASGDYKVLFTKELPANTQQVDCSDVMPTLAAPIVSAGNTNGLGETAPLRNKGVYLERGDRIYVGVWAEGPTTSGYSPGAHVHAQGGFY
jgi:hypothetical protein